MCAPTTSNTTTLAKVDPGSNPKPLQQRTLPMDQSRISNESTRKPLDIMTPVRVVTSLHPPNPSDVTSAARIRSRFLHRLGIERCGSSQNVSAGKQTPCKVTLVNPRYKPQGPCDPRRRNIPANHSTTDSACAETTSSSTTTCNSAASSNQERQKKRSVTFHTECTVFPIPTRYEFSERVRKLLWSTPQELQMNAVRNAVEFAAEGWDWRTVVLDHEMMRNVLTGELVHPIHFYMQREFNLQQHFVQVMAARAQHQQHNHHNHHNTNTKNHNHIRKSRSSPPPRPQQPSCVAISM